MIRFITYLIICGPLFSLGLAAGKTVGLVDVTWWQVAVPYLSVAAVLGTVVLLAMIAAVAVAVDIQTAPLE